MFKSIFQLFNYYLTEYVEELKYVSLYSDQYLRENESDRLPYPAALIEILPIETTQWLNSIQSGIVTVRLHIISEFYTSFSRNDKMIDKSFEHLALLDKIHLMLNHMSSFDAPEDLFDNKSISINTLIRTGVDVSRDFGTLKDSIITYRFKLIDKTALPEFQYISYSDPSDIVQDTNIV